MSHHRIEARALSYAYPDRPGGNPAVTNVSFVLGHGESVGLLGANGAGKSTLLRLLMGILMPDAGEVLIGDVRLTKKTIPRARSRIGMVFPNPDDQLFMPTVYEYVAFGPRNAGLSEDEVDRRVKNALETMGIPHLADRAPYRCSGGEKRAAAVATALSMEPDILILDEPTGELDPKARRRLIEQLKTFEHTKIVAGHDLEMVTELCGRVILLRKGAVAADGAAREILYNERLMDEADLIALK